MSRSKITPVIDNYSTYFFWSRRPDLIKRRDTNMSKVAIRIFSAVFVLFAFSQVFISSPATAQQASCSVVIGTYGAADSSGWTSITPCTASDAPGASNIIYVSASSGSDASNCGTLNGPCKTINYAWQTKTTGTLGLGMRDGHPDWLLLKKGDNFSGQVLGYAAGGATGAFPFTGYSAQAPLVISSYSPTGVTSFNPRGTGTGARPVLNTLSKPYAALYGFTFGSQSGWNKLDYFAIVGLNFYSAPNDPGANLITPGPNPSYDPTYPNVGCMAFYTPTNWFLIEDNAFSFFADAVTTGGAQTVSITGSVSGNALTVTAVPSGFTGLLPQTLYGEADVTLWIGGTGYGTIIAQTSGTPGGVGTYTMSQSNSGTGTQTFSAADSASIHSIMHQNVYIRRNVLAYQYPYTSSGDPGNPRFAAGMELGAIRNLTLEENIAYNNGWYNGVVGEIRNQFNHGFYIQMNDASFSPGTVPNIINRGNTIMSSSGYGMWQRPGGLSENNFFYENGEAQGFGYAAAIPVNQTNVIQNNVILNSQGNDSSGNNPWGIFINLTTFPVTVTNNIVAHAEGKNNFIGIGIGSSAEAANNPINHQVSIQNNIVVDWPAQNNSSTLGANVIDWSTGQVNTTTPNTSILGNALSGAGWPYPNRTLSTYDTEVLGGPGTVADFSSKVLSQSKDTWNSALTAKQVNDYIRAGFGMTTTGTMTTAGTTSTGTTSTGTTSTGTTSTGTTSTGTTSTGTTSTGTTSTETGTTGTGTSTTSTTSTATSTNPPAVIINTPANTAVVKGNSAINIAVSVNDSSAIASIAILMDGNTYQTCVNTSFCAATLQGKKVTRGTHVIGATAIAADGLNGSASVSITALK